MSGLSVRFQGVVALDAFSLHVAAGEIVGLIGPNGAGKTTAINVLSGFQRPSAGQISVGGRSMVGRQPRHFVSRGVARTFQSARLFQRLTVRENVEVTCLARGQSPASARRVADRLLARFGLLERADTPASSVPLGVERLVAVARALASEPRFLLLDEPAAGSNDEESSRLADAIRSIRDELGASIVLVEHDMQVVLNICDRVVVLDHGKTIATGLPGEIRADHVVIEAYFGRARNAPSA